ncbi:uncharacterized protein At1g65710-like [Coffea arabica]|uniref:Uncharacterized protein At1g65710-like n=1 Tax=Coffea arabica TaxID=13443 RepID=A0A6P6TCR6_COFAR|nr:uncharacterized protein At1g65710-like [Coffea arabica]
MGGCLSKKSTCSSCTTPFPNPNPLHQQIKPQPHVENKKSEEETVKKEVFIIKHRKSHDIDRLLSEEEKDDVKQKAAPEIVLESGKIGSADKKNSCNNNASNNGGIFVAAAPVRTSSCTKEEVDAILIQCGRLSRSSSTGKAANLSGPCGSGDNNNGENPAPSQRGRKYSGSKRSYDFDNDNGSDGKDNVAAADKDDDDDIGVVGERSHRHRQRQRQSRTVGSPSKGRRRTPSREREQQQRSGSRERGSSSNGSGRRVSRSPGRRSESPAITTASTGVNSSQGNSNGGNGNRPGKMVSVPATVSSLVMDKSNSAGGGNETVSASAVKRIQVKRNAGGAGDAAVGGRTAASPRARSPARGNVNVLNESQNQNQQHPMSLSRSNSRKAEHSPYRRNPLSEIDTNVVTENMSLPGSKAPNSTNTQKPNSDYTTNNKVAVQGAENKISSSKGIADHSATNLNLKNKEQQHLISEVAQAPQAITSNVAVNTVASGPECLKPQGVTRSRSSRLSRDFDINPETLSNPSPSYTALLLEDIQNFHQKSSTPAISLPPCLSKACSILEAVADLNSSTSSNLSSAFSEDKRRAPTVEQFNKLYDNASFGAHNPAGMKGLDTNAPFVQSEVVVTDDLMQPTFHKYVTVSRGGTVGGEDMEEQESSGSNSFVGGQQYWVSPSSWEPNSADSTECWTSSRSNIRDDSVSPVGFQRHAISKSGHDAEEPRGRLNGKKSDSDQQQYGIGRGRIGSRGPQSVPAVTAAST